MIADRLKKIMDGMTVRDFALKLGKSPSTVQEYLKGRVPPADFIVCVCAQMDVDPWWLMTGEGRVGESGKGMIMPTQSQSQSLGVMVQQQGDDITQQINHHLAQMTTDQRRDVLKYAEEKKLLSELMSERQRKAG